MRKFACIFPRNALEILIQNYRYAPVLRPLRMIAQQIQFRKVPMMSLAKRLQNICDNEGLESDLRTLSLLSETTDGDLRSCLNTLQVSKCHYREFICTSQHFIFSLLEVKVRFSLETC